MRLASFIGLDGPSYGVVRGDGLVDLRRASGGRFPTLKSVLADGDIGALLHSVRDAPADVPLEGLRYLPPLPDPDKIICVGVNYHAHRHETGRAESAYPVLFTRFANTQVGHGEPLVLPRASRELDFEGELAVVMGRRARHVAAKDALGYVAGYACYQDASVRDWQRHTPQFTPGKNFLATGGFGPLLVMTDEIPDPSALTLSLRLNGEQMQHTPTDLMIFDIPALIQYISTFTELVPGDVLVTGTPGGVGWKRTPPVFLRVGDIVEVEVSGVGILRNPVVAEAALSS